MFTYVTGLLKLQPNGGQVILSNQRSTSVAATNERDFCTRPQNLVCFCLPCPKTRNFAHTAQKHLVCLETVMRHNKVNLQTAFVCVCVCWRVRVCSKHFWDIPLFAISGFDETPQCHWRGYILNENATGGCVETSKRFACVCTLCRFFTHLVLYTFCSRTSIDTTGLWFAEQRLALLLLVLPHSQCWKAKEKKMFFRFCNFFSCSNKHWG